MTSKVRLIVDLVVVLGCHVSTGSHWARLLACLEPGSPPGSHIENIFAAEEGPKEWPSELVRRAAYVGCVSFDVESGFGGGVLSGKSNWPRKLNLI